MAQEPSGIDPQSMTPEQFVQLVQSASDDQIVEAIHTTGTEPTLEQIFDGMRESFRPDRAGDTDAKIQWVVVDEGTEHRWVTAIHDGACEVRSERVDDPKVTLTMDLVSLVKMIAGSANGTQLFMTGKLKLSGDMMFAMQIESLFERPTT